MFLLSCGGIAYLLWVGFLILEHPPDMDERFRPTPRISFSEERWKQTRFGVPDRYKMANDLLCSRKLIGATPDQVRKLLGEPKYEEPVQGVILLNYDLIHQSVFPAKGFLLPRFLFMNTDTWLLEIRCTNGRVVTAKIIST